MQTTIIESKTRRKVVIFSIVVAVVILFLFVAAIAVLTKDDQKVAETETKTNYTELTEPNEKSESTSETTIAEPQKTEEKTETVEVIVAQSSLPETGPEKILPVALLFGSLATFLVSEVQTRKNR